MIAALNASAINVRDLEVAPPPVTRMECGARRWRWRDPAAHHARRPRQRGHRLPGRARVPTCRQPPCASSSGSSSARSSDGPSPARSATWPSRRAPSSPTSQELLPSVDTRGVEGAGLKVVVDTADGVPSHGDAGDPGSAARRGAHGQQPAGRRQTDRDRGRPQARAWSGSASWSRRPGRRSASASTRSGSGSRSSTRPAPAIDDDRALLVFLDLVAAERRSRQGGAAGDDDPGGRAGVPLPRRRGGVDHHGARRPGPGVRAARPDLRRRRPRRLRRPRDEHRGRPVRRLRPADSGWWPGPS